MALFVPSVPRVCSFVIVVGLFIWRVLGRVMVCASDSSSSNSIGLLVILFSFLLQCLVSHVLCLGVWAVHWCSWVFCMCCLLAFSMLCVSVDMNVVETFIFGSTGRGVLMLLFLAAVSPLLLSFPP